MADHLYAVRLGKDSNALFYIGKSKNPNNEVWDYIVMLASGIDMLLKKPEDTVEEVTLNLWKVSEDKNPVPFSFNGNLEKKVFDLGEFRLIKTSN